ncbi:DUF3999 family protein [Bacteroidales bacterium OttesenSCG-928-I21]|nr:DUF3999 family protein [Bacteroidales bacterium OttesenSCG-928-I21]
MDSFKYKRKVSFSNEQWQKIMLPNNIFGEIRPDFADIRIYGINDKDTIEVPYLLRFFEDKIESKAQPIDIINQTHASDVYYYTLENTNSRKINFIELDFKEKNFDHRITLEGSQDQLKWETILDDYRILSIQNEHTDFQFTKLNFPAAQYRFFRVSFNSAINSKLEQATVLHKDTVSGNYNYYAPKNMKVRENEKKQSVVTLQLNEKVPISRIEISIADTINYYRAYSIYYAPDSLTSRRYELVRGVLNSWEKTEVKFNEVTSNNIIIIIDNNDNKPLNINLVKASGPGYGLVTRIISRADNYYLCYGNPNIGKPQYDIKYFQDKIPAKIPKAILSSDVCIKPDEKMPSQKTVNHKITLWSLIILIIITLSWFSIKMIKK